MGRISAIRERKERKEESSSPVEPAEQVVQQGEQPQQGQQVTPQPQPQGEQPQGAVQTPQQEEQGAQKEAVQTPQQQGEQQQQGAQRMNLAEQAGVDAPLQQSNYDHALNKMPDAQEAEAIKAKIRSNAIQGMTFEEVMKQGNISPAEYVSELQKKAKEEGRELNAYEATLAMLKADDDETPEAKEKRLKREKAGRIMDALGEFGGSIANMYYTAKGAKPVQFSGKYAAKADEIKAKREALKEKEDAMIREARLGEIGWKRKKELADAEDDKQLQRLLLNLNYRQAKDKADADARDREYARRVARDNADADAKKRQLAEQARHNREKEKNYTPGGRGASRKRIGFSDDKGNSVSINEQVWKGSMQQVFDILVEEEIGRGKETTDYMYNNMIAKMKAKDRDNFVKQNWSKSEKAKKLMLKLSELDPDRMDSVIDEDEESLGWGSDKSSEPVNPNKSNEEELDW